MPSPPSPTELAMTYEIESILSKSFNKEVFKDTFDVKSESNKDTGLVGDYF